MSTLTETRDALRAEDDILREGPIVVASDGTDYSVPALETARELAAESGVHVNAVTVFEPIPLAAFEFGLLSAPPDTIASTRAALLEQLHGQVREVVGESADWSVEVRDGDPATELAALARGSKARLLILGARHRALLDRLFGRETALEVLRLSRTPLLVVPPGFTPQPRRVLVATDFSAASILAARTALKMFESVTLVYLVHVAPRLEQQTSTFVTWKSLFGADPAAGFERVKAELGLKPPVMVESITLEGNPTREILKFARSTHIDLIVTASRGAGFIDRLLVGSTARGLLRGAQCAVFAMRPPAGIDKPHMVAGRDSVSIVEERWAQELEAFTKRNAGRRASIEVDDPEFGAQAQEHDYPLLGAAYDHHDRRVEIMVGDFAGGKRHLTRGITDVQSVDILRDARGRDWILRVSHGDGQTIVTLR